MTSTSRTRSARTKAANPNGMAIDAPLTLLGGLSPQSFMSRYWQKKPFLIRQAVPGVQAPISRTQLFAMVGQDDVESRLIVQTQAKAANPTGQAIPKKGHKPNDLWRLSHGPFTRRQLPPLNQPRWTLLAQGLDLHVPAAHELLQSFRFVPAARMDDLMMSYASDGGGVGPHYDSYDVFLLQVHGQRRWRIGELKDPTLKPDAPLKILAHFEHEQEWLLDAGDMLYLPPRWAHDGIAVGNDCMTCSIGFRAPEAIELAKEILVRWWKIWKTQASPAFTKTQGNWPRPRPGLMPAQLQQFAADAVARVLKDPHALRTALGEILTEPKPRVWFESGEPLPDGVGVHLDARTRIAYDEHCVFANGESWRAAGNDARHLRLLADKRSLEAKIVAQASPALRELLDQWAEDGWLHPTAANER